MPLHRHRVTHTRPLSSENTGAAARRNPRPSAAPVFIHPAAQRPSPDGPGVLLIHGGSGSALIWAHLEPLLRNRGLPVQVVEAPQHPAAELTADAAVLAHRLEPRSGGRRVIVGHGSGAGVAVALAATAPDCAQALILIAPTLQPPVIPLLGRALAAPVLGSAIAWLGFRAAGLAFRLPSLRRRLLVDGAGLTTTQAAQVMHSFSRGRAWRRFSIEQRRRVDEDKRLRRLLDQIDCPTLIIAGRHDRVALFAVVSVLAGQLPGALLVPTDSGHLIPVDEPDLVLNAVLRARELRSRPAADPSNQRRN
jgi:pimeloyl-ACP methyl ester carboxylesterase